MSWMQKLCEVYDTMLGVPDCTMAPEDFTYKRIEYNIILTSAGAYCETQQLPKKEPEAMVPRTPEAEVRTSGSEPRPFPLAEQLEYLIADGKSKKKFEVYLEQLTDWCAQPDAPQCLRTLRDYLAKETLLSDLKSDPGLKSFPKRDAIACFSVQNATEEHDSLWLREDVRASWQRYVAAQPGADPDLCYVSGTLLPPLKLHPKVEGNAKLISSRDSGYPGRYKGRFVEDGSAAVVSSRASLRAHNALDWLMRHQGFRRYGMHLVAWNTAAPALSVDEDAAGDTDYTFEGYARALRDAAAAGEMAGLQGYMEPDDLTDEAQRRMNEVVILGMQAATDGHMSITYYQEIPGNLYVARLAAWAGTCRWEMPRRGEWLVASPTWRAICEAVIGPAAVQRAYEKPEESDAKRMRKLQLRLLSCVVNASPLPLDFARQAFRRAVQPQRFSNKDGGWNRYAWQQCVATACALIRKTQADRGRPVPGWELDMSRTDRDYLYGRLLAVAHKLELDATQKPDRLTAALRRMPRFVQAPGATWLRLYCELLPYLRKLGQEPDHRRADWYLRQLGTIERQFPAAARAETGALSEDFLLGFSAQLRALYQKDGAACTLPPYAPPQGRDARYGCLLAVADVCEWNAAWKDEGSLRDGRTNAMQLTAVYVADPARVWAQVHDKLIPYLEQSGPTARRMQRLIGRIEQGFAEEERRAGTALGSGFLQGYLGMRLALRTKDGLDADAWALRRGVPAVIDSRDAAFGALLSLENQVERWAMDVVKRPDEERPSNAMRFLARAAQRPDEVTAYLLRKMRPYQDKLHFPARIEQERERLTRLLEARGWDSAAPLGPGYLHTFYTYDMFEQDGKEG